MHFWLSMWELMLCFSHGSLWGGSWFWFSHYCCVHFDPLIMVVSVRLLHQTVTFFPLVISNFYGEVVCKLINTPTSWSFQFISLYQYGFMASCFVYYLCWSLNYPRLGQRGALLSSGFCVLLIYPQDSLSTFLFLAPQGIPGRFDTFQEESFLQGAFGT